MSWSGAESNVKGPIGCPKGYIGLDFSTTKEWKPSTPKYIKEVEKFYLEMYDKLVVCGEGSFVEKDLIEISKMYSNICKKWKIVKPLTE